MPRQGAAHPASRPRRSSTPAVISGVPTNTRGTAHYDNIVFDARGATEFTGRAGVYDMMREQNISMQEALELSDHLPVYAEFHIREGGAPGRVASQPAGLR